MGVAVAALVFLLEFFLQIPRERKVEFVSLAAVADVHARLIVHSSLPGFVVKIFCGFFLQSGELSLQLSVWNLACNAPQDGAGVVLHNIAEENAESGKGSRQRGHDHVRDAEGFGQGAGVQASGAAESDEGEVAGIATALDGDYADSFLHGGVHHADYSGSEAFQGKRASPLLQPFAGDAAGAVDIESKIATQKLRGLQAAQ